MRQANPWMADCRGGCPNQRAVRHPFLRGEAGIRPQLRRTRGSGGRGVRHLGPPGRRRPGRGLGRRGPERPWRPDTLVDVYSVGKAVVALLALQLVDRGRIGLDDPIGLGVAGVRCRRARSRATRAPCALPPGRGARHPSADDRRRSVGLGPHVRGAGRHRGRGGSRGPGTRTTPTPTGTWSARSSAGSAGRPAGDAVARRSRPARRRRVVRCAPGRAGPVCRGDLGRSPDPVVDVDLGTLSATS